MNCTKCNTPEPAFELIGGLCFTCTAKERDELRSELTAAKTETEAIKRERNLIAMQTRAEWMSKIKELECKLEVASVALVNSNPPVEVFTTSGCPVFGPIPTADEEKIRLLDSQLTAANKACAEMRECLRAANGLIVEHHSNITIEKLSKLCLGGNCPVCKVDVFERFDKALSTDCGKGFVPQAEVDALKADNQRLREELVDRNEGLAAELNENLQLFAELGFNTPEDFGNDTSTAALRKRIASMVSDNRRLIKAVQYYADNAGLIFGKTAREALETKDGK